MKITIACLIGCLSLVGCVSGPGDRAPTPEELFRKADADGNGSVSREEFGDFMVAQVFSYYDRKGRGFVDLGDYIAGGGTPAGFREINRSGSGKITLEEAKNSKLVRETMIVPFDEADLNGNGSVSLEEFLAYRKRAQPYVR